MPRLPRWAAIVVLVVVLLGVVVTSPTAFAVIFIVGLVVFMPWMAAMSAWSVPVEAWRAAGRSRARWLIAFFIIPFGVSAVASLAYFLVVRRRLPTGVHRGATVLVGPGWYGEQRGLVVGRDWLTFGVLWRVRLSDGGGSQGKVVRRSADVLHSVEDSPAVRAQPSRSPRTRLLALGMLVASIGTALFALGLADGDFVIAGFGAIAVGLGLFQIGITLIHFGPHRRLPRELRPSGDMERPLFTLELRDGERITATPVFSGGYVLRRRGDPPFDAREVVAVVPATPEEAEAQGRRLRGD